MADLTYNIFTGSLVVRGSDGRMVVAFAHSGSSNIHYDSATRQKGKHGSPGHVHGGPIPPGRWRVKSPGSAHPDGGRLRPRWIPIGPVKGRTHIYIHCGTVTEGCINVPRAQRKQFDEIFDIVRRDGGGWIYVTGGNFV